VDNLCADDILVALDLLKIHHSTTFVTRGLRREVSRSQLRTKKYAALLLQMLNLRAICRFLNPKVRPSCNPSRRFSAEDSRFITEAENKLLPWSRDHRINFENPWRTQVVVIMDEIRVGSRPVSLGGRFQSYLVIKSHYGQWRSQSKNLGEQKILGAKIFDFRRITLFCLEKRLSKHKMTIFSKMLGEPWLLCPPWLRLWLRVHYSKRDEIYFTTLLWQNS